MGSTPSRRLAWLDWARGLCVLLMIHMHAFYAWVRPDEQREPLFRWTLVLGGYPGAVFLFLAGLVLALACEGEAGRGVGGRERLRRGVLRGLEVFLYAALFRLWMFTSGRFLIPGDLLRVDILNAIAGGLLLAALAGVAWPDWRARAIVPLLVAAAMAVATPYAWDGGLARRLPQPLGAYLSGRVHNALFPLFPWSAFAVLGAAAGVLLSRARQAGREPLFAAGCAALGVVAFRLGFWLDRVSPVVEPRYDFWYTSPHFFLVKAGVVLVTVAAAWVLDRLPGQEWVRRMGRTSLLIYWAHLEIVYGDHVLPRPRGSLSVEEALAGVALLAAAMLGLSHLRSDVYPRLRERVAARRVRLIA